jgi:hypothetical protein
LLPRKPLESVHHLAAFLIEDGEQSRKKQLPFFLPVGCVAADKLGNRCFGGIERSAGQRVARPNSSARDRFPTPCRRGRA